MQALGGGHWLLNNGAAGMPNVAGELTGLCTRIARAPLGPVDAGPSAPMASVNAQGLHLSLCRIPYDTARWALRFGAAGPPTRGRTLLWPPHRCRANLSARAGAARLRAALNKPIAVSASSSATGLAPCR